VDIIETIDGLLENVDVSLDKITVIILIISFQKNKK